MSDNSDLSTHPVHKLFFDTFAQRAACSTAPLLDLGVGSLALIGFLSRVEDELCLPLERLLGSTPLTLGVLMNEYDRASRTTRDGVRHVNPNQNPTHPY